MKIPSRAVSALLALTSVLTAQTAPPAPQPAPRPELVVRSTDFGQFFTLAVSPAGEWYAALNHEGRISIVSTRNGFEYRNFAAPATNFIFATLAISSDSNTIALPTGTNPDGKSHIMLIDVKTTARKPDIIFGRGDAVAALAFHPQQDILAAATSGGQVYLLRASTGEVLYQAQLTADLPQLQFSPGGDLLLGVTRSELHVWDWKQQKELWHADAHQIHTANLNRILTFPDFFDNNRIKDHTAESLGFFQMAAAVFSPDGRRIAVLHQDEANLLDAATGSKSTSLAIDPLKDGEARSALFVSDTKLYVGQLKTAYIFDTSTRASTEYPAAANNQVLAIPKSSNLLIHLGGGVGIKPVDGGPWVSFVQSRLASPLGTAQFSADGNDLFAGVNGQMNISDWKMQTGELDSRAILGNDPQILAQSRDGRYVAFYIAEGVPNDALHVWDRRASREVAKLTVGLGGNSDSIAFSPDGKWLASISGVAKKLRLWSIPGFTPVAVSDVSLFTDGVGFDGNLAFSPGSDLLAVTAKNMVDLYSLKSPLTRVRQLPILKETESFILGAQTHTVQDDNRSNSVAVFSPDGKRFVVLGDRNAHLFDTATWTQTGFIPNTFFRCAAFSPDSRKLALVTTHDAAPEKNGDPAIDRLTLWDIDGGKPVFATGAGSCPVSFNMDGSLLAAGVPGGLGLFSAQDGALRVSFYRFSNGGRIMDDDAHEWLAVTPDGLFDGTPGAWSALSWRFNGDTFTTAPVEAFFREFFRPGLLGQIAGGETPKPVASFEKLDRRQPLVALSAGDVSAPIAENHVHLQLSLSESRQKAEGEPAGSGVRDIRLFRNGTLVKIWRGDRKLDAAGTLQLDADIPIVAGQNSFTAYAFNHDNIKSPDATLVVKGSAKLRRQGTAYVLAIGINQYAVASLKLSYAEADADDFARQFTADQQALGDFASVKVVRLFSADATQANILAALGVMAGASPDKLTDSQRTLFKDLAAVQPEDGVFLYYAGHGGANATHFYFIPTDYDSKIREAASPASHAISEEQLAQALENIAPARAFLVIDACNSGKALDNANNIPVGPLNSTGLAQVAYEKGIFILAASKDSERAQEASMLGGGHGYLTYALVDQGLKDGEAARNGVVELRPWFEFATRRVPQLPRMMLEKLDRANGTPITQADEASLADLIQHPRIFYRREPETTPFVVAKPAPPMPASSPVH